MNQRPFVRKIIYLAIIAGLLLPLSRLSQPATNAAAGRQASPGGKLAQKRDDFKLGQANLGKIDPTSEALKLATLGLRPLAVVMLWSKVDEFKMKEDWTSLSATLEQIKNLQPNYIGVWRFQSWNLSYNISAEFDDYRERYYWVKRGIEYLQEGTSYNENEPRLLSDVGWFATNKIGRADEHVQYRRLFREDDEFHNAQRVHQRDNWLFGREYYLEAERVVDNLGVHPATSNPLIFHSQPSMAQINYAVALDEDYGQALNAAAMKPAASKSGDLAAEREQRFQEIDKTYRAKITTAWDTALAKWREYSDREFLGYDGQPYRLSDLATAERNLEKAMTELESLAPGMRKKIEQEKQAQLTPDEREVLKIDIGSRSEAQQKLAGEAEDLLSFTHHDVAERAPLPVRGAAHKLADQIYKLQDRLTEVRGGRSVTNFEYWLTRCEVERSDDAREARRLIHRATTALTIEADLVTSRENFEKGFVHWRAVVDKYPDLRSDLTAFNMVDSIKLYKKVLQQRDEPFPKDFVLQVILDDQNNLH
jgi:hypothetical protein